MTTIYGKAVGQWLIPGKIDPYVKFSYNTHRYYGEPEDKQVFEKPKFVPKTIGDERHQELISAIGKLGAKVDQNVTQEARQALPERRDWR